MNLIDANNNEKQYIDISKMKTPDKAYLNKILLPLFFFHGLPQIKITKVDFDDTPKRYKTLIPFKKKKRGGKKELLMWLIKDGHRNKLKLKGREKQKDKWRFGILNMA